MTIRKNTKPIANPDSFSATGGPTTFDIVPLNVIKGGSKDIDLDGDDLEIARFDPVEGLSVNGSGDGFLFSPPGEGTFTFQYTVRDKLDADLQDLEMESDPAMVEVTIGSKIPTPKIPIPQ